MKNLTLSLARRLTPLTLTGAALALFLGTAPLATVHADEPSPDSPAADVADTESGTIQWVETRAP